MASFIETLTQQNEYREFINEFEKENKAQSDRGVVLVCISILDEMLAELLKVKLIKDDKLMKEIFGTKGVFGQFDDKMKACYALGVISGIDFELLKKMQQVRNKFAHRVLNTAFEEESIKAVCKNIELPKNAFIPRNIPFMKEGETELPKVELNPIKGNTSPRERFVYAFYFLFMEIQSRLIINVDSKITKLPDVITQVMVWESVEKELNWFTEELKEMNFHLSEEFQRMDKKCQFLNVSIQEMTETRNPSNEEKKIEFRRELIEAEEKCRSLEVMIKENEEKLKEIKDVFEHLYSHWTYTTKVIENSKV